MSERKAPWTPGPWVEFAVSGRTTAIIPASRSGDVCRFGDPYPTRANARLIAAAPEMAALLEDWRSFNEDVRPMDEPIRFTSATLLERTRALLARIGAP